MIHGDALGSITNPDIPVSEPLTFEELNDITLMRDWIIQRRREIDPRKCVACSCSPAEYCLGLLTIEQARARIYTH